MNIHIKDSEFDMHKLFTRLILLIIFSLIIGCVSYKKCHQVHLPEDNLSLDFANDPVEIMTGGYSITITPYSKPLHDSDSNEEGLFLSEEDIKRGEAMIN